MQPSDKGMIARTFGRLSLEIANVETKAALEQNASLAAFLVHIARLRHLRRLPSAAAARATGW